MTKFPPKLHVFEILTEVLKVSFKIMTKNCGFLVGEYSYKSLIQLLIIFQFDHIDNKNVFIIGQRENSWFVKVPFHMLGQKRRST